MAKRCKTGGRTKGTPNRFTHDVRQGILYAAEGLGGSERLLQWAQSDPINERIFWSSIYIKILPKEIKAEIGNPSDLAPVINLTLSK